MPELPEVETIVRDIRPRLVGRRIVGVETDWPKYLRSPRSLRAFRGEVAGRRIRAVDRRGKFVLIHLEADRLLLIHHKISGRLRVGRWQRVRARDGGPRRQWEPVPPTLGRYVHLLFDLDNHQQLALSDLRKFGSAVAGRTARVLNRREVRALGPEPLDAGFTFEAFAQLCRRRRGRLKSLLMNQTFVAGIGNIYSDEILYVAGLHPKSRLEALDSRQLRRLYRSIRSVLRRAVRLRGTGIDAPPVPAGGAKGYDRVRFVYQRPVCPRGHHVAKIRIGGRSAHFCPKEQRLVG